MLRIESSSEVVTAWLSGEIDHHTARELREGIDREVNKWRPRTLVLDFGGVSFMDSSGIGLVMGRFKNVRAIGGQVRVTGCPPQVYKVMKVAGIERLAELDKPQGRNDK